MPAVKLKPQRRPGASPRDSWEHDVQAEKILPPDPAFKNPICLAGLRLPPLYPARRDLGSDWGICANPKSPRAGLLTFEHQGCPQFRELSPGQRDELLRVLEAPFEFAAIAVLGPRAVGGHGDDAVVVARA